MLVESTLVFQVIISEEKYWKNEENKLTLYRSMHKSEMHFNK